MVAECILVTGAAGFIGSHVADALEEVDHQIIRFDKKGTGKEMSYAGDMGNIIVLDCVKAAMKGCSGVVHLAAVSRERMAREDPARCIETNVLGTLNILEAARLQEPHPWVILASTRDVPSGTYAARSLYGASWLSAEILARRYAEDYGLRVLALRLSDVYGSERDHPGKLMPNLVSLILEGQSVTVANAVGRQFDFTHYTDVQRAFIMGAEWIAKSKPGTFEAVTICTGRSITAEALVRLIMFQAKRAVRMTSAYRTQPMERIFNNTRVARELLGFETHIPLEVGIDRMIRLHSEQVKV